MWKTSFLVIVWVWIVDHDLMSWLNENGISKEAILFNFVFCFSLSWNFTFFYKIIMIWFQATTWRTIWKITCAIWYLILEIKQVCDPISITWYNLLSIFTTFTTLYFNITFARLDYVTLFIITNLWYVIHKILYFIHVKNESSFFLWFFLFFFTKNLVSTWISLLLSTICTFVLWENIFRNNILSLVDFN